jgi:hypothetical protein
MPRERKMKKLHALRRMGLSSVVVLTSSTAAAAQDSPAHVGFALGAAAGYVAFGGEAFQRVRSAFGFGAAGRYTWDSNLQVVVGVNYSNHGVEETESDLSTLVVFVDPRYVFPMIDTERFSPYFGGRVGYVRLSTSSGEASANGLTLGGVAGFYFEIVPKFAFEFFGYFGGLLLDAGRAEGLPFESDDANGNLTMLEAGFVYSLQ